MEDKYTKTKNTVSLINYHFVFCPRYRRKIFKLPGIKERFEELVFRECDIHGIKILAMECRDDYVYIFINCPPDRSPADVMNLIKRGTSKALRHEFGKLAAMPSLWTRSYFVSTEGTVSREIIKAYVESQKTRP